MTLKNETKRVLVVRETAGPMHQPILGKSIRLQPGVTYREYHPTAGAKDVAVFDAATPATPLLKERLVWGKDDTAFSLQAEGNRLRITEATKRGDEKALSVKR